MLSFAGSTQMRIAYCEPKIVTSPTPLRAVERVEQVGRDVVGEVLVAHAAVGGDEAEHDEEVARRLVDAHARLLHLLRQVRHGELQLVLHLHLRGVRVRALREGERDASPSRPPARRR